MYKVSYSSHATGTTEREFETFEDAKNYIINFYGGSWFYMKLYKDDELIGENIFGIGWNWIKEEV